MARLVIRGELLSAESIGRRFDEDHTDSFESGG